MTASRLDAGNGTREDDADDDSVDWYSVPIICVYEDRPGSGWWGAFVGRGSWIRVAGAGDVDRARCATRVVPSAKARVQLTPRKPVTSPAGEGVRIGAKGVVTGGKGGLRASGDKGIAKKIAREAFVTAW